MIALATANLGYMAGLEQLVDGALHVAAFGEPVARMLRAGGVETLDKSAVGQAFVADTSGDTLNPETTELAFPLLAVTVFVGVCFANRVLCVAVEFRAESAETLRTKEDTLTLGT